MKLQNFLKHSWQNNLDEANNVIETPKERYTSPGKRQQDIDKLRLV